MLFTIIALLVFLFSIKAIIKLIAFLFAIGFGLLTVIDIVLIISFVLSGLITSSFFRKLVRIIIGIGLFIITLKLFLVSNYNLTIVLLVTFFFCWLYYKVGEINSKLLRIPLRIPIFLVIFRLSAYIVLDLFNLLLLK